MTKLIMSLAAAARYLNAKRATLIFYVSKGDLCAMLIDGRLLLHQPHLDDFVREQAEKQAADIRRTPETTVAAKGQKQPDLPGIPPPKKRDAQRERALPQREPGVVAPSAKAADVSEAQPELPGQESRLRQPKEPR